MGTMRDRTLLLAKSAPRRLVTALDLVVVTPGDAQLGVLLVRGDAKSRDRWTLPWDGPRQTEAIDDAALRLARAILGSAPPYLSQIGALADARRHPSDAELSIAYLAAMPAGTAPPSVDETAWHPLNDLPPLPPRHRQIIERAQGTLRHAVDEGPIAFRLLPATFTLTELQGVYEILLGRALHKASFRRALQAAFLVEPLDEWRTEGRGRPAQLFRYAPRKRRGGRRGVRFDFLDS